MLCGLVIRYVAIAWMDMLVLYLGSSGGLVLIDKMPNASDALQLRRGTLLPRASVSTKYHLVRYWRFPQLVVMKILPSGMMGVDL